MPYKIHESTTQRDVDFSQGTPLNTPVDTWDRREMIKNNRTARLDIRLKPEEKEKIEKSARGCGLSLTEYVISSCLEKGLKSKSPEELWELFDELYSVIDELPEDWQQKLARLIINLQEAI